MNSVAPFPIHEYGARPHQAAAHDRKRPVFAHDVDNETAGCVEHVRAGVPLTPKGRALLEEFARRVS